MNNKQKIEPNRDRIGYAGGETWVDGFEQKTSNVNKRYQEMDTTDARSKNKPTRFFVDNEYVNKGYLALLPPQATLAYFALLMHCGTKTMISYPGLDRLQKLTGIKNRNYLIDAMRILEELNIIQVDRTSGGKRNPNIYLFIDSDLWLGIDQTDRQGRLTIQQYQKTYKTVSVDTNNEYQY